ncbi:MAG: hypothetical protein VR69_12345 [Peptococcaceae bacterium BRH_c4b]|nr:MAG: hypothetical protein VR69_12345 [Peptococcaceae bacterium BRH_c4b]
MLYNAAIIDDNIVFADFLLSVLKKSTLVAKISVFNSAEDFLCSWQDQYNLLFVDIGLPKRSGIELVKTVNKLPYDIQTVFITAHPEFAAEAMLLNVCGYLLKPVSEENILNTLYNIQKNNLPGINSLQQTVRENKKLMFRKNGRIKIIPQKDIIFIEKQGKNCVIHTVAEKVRMPCTLESMEKSLDNILFFKSHRSYIINMDMISRTERWADRAYRIRMKNTGEEPLLSRSKIKAIESLLKLFRGRSNQNRQP